MGSLSAFPLPSPLTNPNALLLIRFDEKQRVIVGSAPLGSYVALYNVVWAYWKLARVGASNSRESVGRHYMQDPSLSNYRLLHSNDAES